MNQMVNGHLQQRKSSLTSLSKTKSSRQSQLISSRALKYSSKQNLYVHDKQMNRQFCKGSNQIDVARKAYAIDNNINDEICSSSTKRNMNMRLRDQESSDYIRNLYKKYLGKENKQGKQHYQHKSIIDIYTERKLRTTESKQILFSNSHIKDFTKRALFTERQNQNIITTGMKRQKTKVSTILSRQNQVQSQNKKYENIKGIKVSTQVKKTTYRKQPSKKTQTQRQFQSKKSSVKNYKSKPRVQVQENDLPSVYLKRSNSTQLRKQPSQYSRISSNKDGKKQKLYTQSSHAPSEQRMTQQSKKSHKLKGDSSHPHRESYTQFDTQQQIQESYNCKFNYGELQPRENIQEKCQQQNGITKDVKCGAIYEVYINDLDSLRMLVGEENSLFRALRIINKVKQMKKEQRSSSKNRFPYDQLTTEDKPKTRRM